MITRRFILVIITATLTITAASTKGKTTIVDTRQQLTEGYEYSKKQSESYKQLSLLTEKYAADHRSIAENILKESTSLQNQSEEFTKNGDKLKAAEYAKKAKETLKKYQEELTSAQIDEDASIKYKRRSVDFMALAEHYQHILDNMNRKFAEQDSK